MKKLGAVNLVKTGKQQGFTIIELVVVILLLGILTATALPRFLDVTDEAHAAVVDGVYSGLNTGVALFHAQWVGKGQPAGTNALADWGDETLAANTLGYPIGVSGNAVVTTDTDCLTVFDQILQVGRPSSAAAANGTVEAATAAQLNYNVDITAFGTTAATCAFAYTGQGAAVSSPVLNYSATTGAVSVGTAL